VNWDQVAALAEVVGAVAVVASLMYVAAQIRQNTVAIRSNTIQAISDQANNLNIALATDERLPRLVAEMFEKDVGREDLSPEDRWRLGMTVMAGLRRFENVYLQVQAGILDTGAFGRIGFDFYRTRFSRETWQTLKAAFDPDFVRFVDEALDRDEGSVTT